jgi:hypothetical protein
MPGTGFTEPLYEMAGQIVIQGRTGGSASTVEGVREVEVYILLAWIALVGAVGAAVNALSADDTRFWPSCIEARGNGRVMRVGLVGHALVGAVAAVAIASAFAVLGWTSSQAPFAAAPAFLAAMATGMAASRCVTAASDTRLLRAALRMACAAPAAHPDTVHALGTARPLEAYRLACDLAPPGLAPLGAGGGDGDDAVVRARRSSRDRC